MLLTKKRHLCLFAAAWIGGTVLYCRRESIWPAVLALLVLFLIAGIADEGRSGLSGAAVRSLVGRLSAAGRGRSGRRPVAWMRRVGRQPAAGMGRSGKRAADGASRTERLAVVCLVAALFLTAFFLCAGRDRYAASVSRMLDAHPGTELSGTVLSKEIRSEQCVYTLRTPYKKVTVYYDTDEIPIGSYVTVQGDWRAFTPATNEGSFDSADYYQNQNISFRIYADEILVERASRGNVREGLYRLQQRISRVFTASLSADEAGVLSALTVGNKGLMDPEVKELYQEAGISHILAISGLHISILGLGIYRFLKRLRVPAHLCEALGCGVVLLFVVMSGGSVSAIRALVMYLLLMGSHATGRTYDPVNALAFAALALLIPNPMNLFQSGFQFSFLAMAAITLFREMSRRTAGARRKLERARPGGRPAGAARDQTEPLGSAAQEPRTPAPGGRFAASLRERLLFSAFLQLALLPLTAWYYFEVPLYATFLNLLILPLCSALLGFGLAGGLLGILLPQAAKWLLVPCHVILRIYEGAIRLIDLLPLSNWITGQPSAWMLLAFYAALALACLLYLRRLRGAQEAREMRGARRTVPEQAGSDTQKLRPAREEQRAGWAPDAGAARPGAFARPLSSQRNVLWDGPVRRMEPGTGFACRREPDAGPEQRTALVWLVVFALFACILFVPERQISRVDFLDVGQGDGIFLTDGAGTRVMIDGGSSSESSVGEYEIEPFLKVHGIRKVDAWIVTHGDSDHYSGLLEILEDGYRVDCLLLAEAMPRDEAWADLVAAAEANGTEVVYVAAGDAIAVAGGTMTCLYPDAEDGVADGGTGSASTAGSVDGNAFSQVWRFDQDGLSVLFTGDISAEQEETLLSRGLLSDITVLKVAHHGSKYSSCEEFLAAVSPEYAVISCSANNIYGHPAPETLARLSDAACEIRRTTQSGQITFYEKRGRWKVHTYLHEP